MEKQQDSHDRLVIALLALIVLALIYIGIRLTPMHHMKADKVYYTPTPMPEVRQEEVYHEPTEEKPEVQIQRKPAANTLAVSNITGICGFPMPGAPACNSNPQATLNGSYNGNGATTTTWFEYWTAQDKTNVKSTPHRVQSANSGNISEVIPLDPGFSYEYRIVTENSAGKTYGEIKNFSVAIG